MPTRCDGCDQRQSRRGRDDSCFCVDVFTVERLVTVGIATLPTICPHGWFSCNPSPLYNCWNVEAVYRDMLHWMELHRIMVNWKVLQSWMTYFKQLLALKLHNICHYQCMICFDNVLIEFAYRVSILNKCLRWFRRYKCRLNLRQLSGGNNFPLECVHLYVSMPRPVVAI